MPSISQVYVFTPAESIMSKRRPIAAPVSVGEITREFAVFVVCTLYQGVYEHYFKWSVKGPNDELRVWNAGGEPLTGDVLLQEPLIHQAILPGARMSTHPEESKRKVPSWGQPAVI
ncbi:hypothetical protein BC832DRAFT_108781 [Gaertneriomyces semiglobifer]|nr:hypothetical protein BC832DRAFT_108781 [Gaertneriomyces semiglobifer]